ncbi:hypothetical protein V4U86_09515 [Mycobacterium sp. AMU20-3851]|uniref:DUF7155 family protein n=1 Tax=Mycobacterium sp. AMU20-3851 TaxID=3122055 RepID=UPI003753EC54
MASLSGQKRRFIVVGAFAAAVAAPVLALSATPAESVQAGPACLAWFGNKDDGNCLSYSNGNGVAVGTPGAGFCNGGFCTSPIFPGNSWNTNIPLG